MNHIEIGDYVVSLIDFNDGILINGEKYLVINTNNDDIIIICSDNKIHQFSNEYFVKADKHLTKYMLKVGDKFICNLPELMDVTQGKVYIVTGIEGESVRFIDDVGDEGLLHKRFITLVPSNVSPLEKIIQERRFGITDECINAHIKATERIKLLTQTIEGATKKKQALEEGVDELNSSFEKLDKPGCLSAMKKLGKVLNSFNLG